jgi:hypothetical protein
MIFRIATEHDVAATVEMIVDDELGKPRESFKHHYQKQILVLLENQC